MTTDGPRSTEERRPGPAAELDRLKKQAREMGEWARTMVHDGWEAFRTGDLELAQKVLDRDSELDRHDQEIEHKVVSYLVVQKPSAGDLRTAAALLKVTTHLDRIGRLGFDMARITTSDDSHDVPQVLELLSAMDQTAESMVVQSLEALERGDAEMAKQLFKRDDEVDRMHRQATRLCIRELVNDPMSAQHLSGDLLVARHFERIADNACKIAERTIYAVTGQRRAEYLPRHPYRPYALEGGRGQ